MKVKSILKSSVSILVVISMTFSMVVASGAIVSAAEKHEESVGDNAIPSQIKAANGVTYNYIGDDMTPESETFYLDVLNKSNQFENWASVMYAMLENGGGYGYKSVDGGISRENGISQFKQDFGYGNSKFGYGTKINTEYKNREHGRLIRMVEALKGNEYEATRYKYECKPNSMVENYIVTPKTATSPEVVYNELMNYSCKYNSSKCSQSGIEKHVDLQELKNLKSSSSVVYSLFNTTDVFTNQCYSTSMGLMFYNISMVPLCDDLKETYTETDNKYDSEKTYALINNSTVNATLGGGLTNSQSESKSNSVEKSFTGGFRLSQKISFNWKLTDPVNFLWKFPSEFTAGAEFGTEEFFQWGNTTTNTNTITKEKNESSSFSMDVPAQSVGTATQKSEKSTAITKYDGPIAITYDVAMFSFGTMSYEARKNMDYIYGTSFFATFSSSPEGKGKAEDAVDALNEMSGVASGFNGCFKDGKTVKKNREAIVSSWNNTLNTIIKNDNCATIAKNITNNQPMSKFNGTLEEKVSKVTYEVGKNYALEPIGAISVSKCNEYNDNYQLIRTLELDGNKETCFKYDKIEAYTLSGLPFIGWTAKYGYWVLESPDGTESAIDLNTTVADDNVLVRMNSAGDIFVTPIKDDGESCLKYVIVDNHFKYYPYDEKSYSEKAILMDENTLEYCTNEDIPEGFSKGKIVLNVNSNDLDEDRIGLETKVDGKGQIKLDKYVAKPGEKIKVSVNAEKTDRISKIVAQYHEDKRDPSKVTREEVLSRPSEDIKVNVDYVIPEDTTSKVSIVAKTKSLYLNLDANINEGEVILSNYKPYYGDDVSIKIKVPENYVIQEIKAEYPNDEGVESPEIIAKNIISNDYELIHKFKSDAIISVVTKPLSEVELFDTDKSGNFIINTFNDLQNLSCTVNKRIDEYINADYIIANDIDCKGKVWSAPIGTHIDFFEGTLDGQGHIIKNLNVDSGLEDGKRYPLFSQLSKKAVVKNLTIDNASISTSKSYKKGSGGIAQENHGTIQNCIVKNSTIEIIDSNDIGGISSKNFGRIENCAVIDCTISRIGDGVNTDPIGGIVQFQSGTLKDCFTYGCTFNNGTSENGGICASGFNIVENCYYYTTSEVCGGFGTAKNVEQFASGEVACLLGDAWKQTIGKDKYPVLSGDKIYSIYKSGYTF